MDMQLLKIAVPLALVVGLAACGGGGGGEPVDRRVSGVLTAPNGTTPIPDATVYFGGGGKALVAKSDGGSCAEPPVPAEAWTCTGPDGSFELDFVAPQGRTRVDFFKGSWSGSFETQAREEDVGSVAFSQNPDEGAARIAVITGIYDQIETVLIKLGMTTDPDSFAAKTAPVGTSVMAQQLHQTMHAAYGDGFMLKSDGDCPPMPGWPDEYPWPPPGVSCDDLPDDWGDWGDFGQAPWLGTETFDIYIGTRPYGEPGEYPSFAELFELDGSGTPRLMDYDILYVNCAVDLPDNGNWPAIIEQFVSDGGMLYVTDLSSEWLTVPFSSRVARVSGNGGDPDEGAVPDAELRAWLQSVDCGGAGCISGSGRIALEGFLAGWHLLAPQHNSVTPRVTDVQDERVLTMSFPYGSGTVNYSSYHTTTGFAADPHYTPQERVLEYLFYQGGGSVD